MRRLLLFLILSSVGFGTSVAFAQSSSSKPTILITKQQKSDQCPLGSGYDLQEAMVYTANQDEYIDVVVFLQKYNGSWERNTFRRKGTGLVQLNLNSCDYTGNYYAFADFSNYNGSRIPNTKEIEKKHNQMGTNPKFRVSKRIKMPDCDGQEGVIFEEGQVFTPKGERVKITLFMQKQDGSWRKKHYSYVGSGFINMDIKDCSLNGNYKTRVVIDH